MAYDLPKGGIAGICNRTACDNPKAVFYNRYTYKYYCPACARKINEAGDTDDRICTVSSTALDLHRKWKDTQHAHQPDQAYA